MQLTPEQQAIINSTGNIKINAVAGSGKTTTIIPLPVGGNFYNSYSLTFTKLLSIIFTIGQGNGEQ